ncbi:MAG: flavodoxin [Candidatus Lokiarchaeota archaeon]|nr:flavodoxin [Candidatus Lokiarchaeota archaeon]
MNSLVVVFSRTGRTKGVAKSISERLNCDFEEIIDTKKWSGFFGFIRAGYAAMKGKTTIIEIPQKNPDNYDLILIGTPVWGSRVPPAIRTYLLENKNKLKEVGFFCTQGGSGSGGKIFNNMLEICEKKPIATLELTKKMIKEGSHDDKIIEFLNKMQE